MKTVQIPADRFNLSGNSRIVNNPDVEAKIASLAESIAASGQLQPIQAYANDDGTYTPIFGFTRVAACLHANVPVETVVVDRPEEKTAFILGIRENHDRSDLTDVQEALQQRRLRTEFKLKDAEIARVYGYNNQNRVLALKKLLRLEQSVIDAVHEGRLSLSAALEAAKVDAEKRAAAAEEGSTAAEISGKRGKPQILALAKEVCDESTVLSPAVKEFFGVFSSWIAGDADDKKLWRALNALGAGSA